MFIFRVLILVEIDMKLERCLFFMRMQYLQPKCNTIFSAVPDLAFQPFQLMTTFPNKVIEDENLSLKDAGLLNSVIVVKFIG
jgi:hypothetical protein